MKYFQIQYKPKKLQEVVSMLRSMNLVLETAFEPDESMIVGTTEYSHEDLNKLDNIISVKPFKEK